jgi:hypothetical protein
MKDCCKTGPYRLKTLEEIEEMFPDRQSTCSYNVLRPCNENTWMDYTELDILKTHRGLVIDTDWIDDTNYVRIPNIGFNAIPLWAITCKPLEK